VKYAERMAALRVLLIEDDPAVAKVLKILLLEHPVTHVRSMEEARAALLVTEVGLIITTPRLRDGSGIDLLRELKQAGHPATRILHTAHVPPDLDELESSKVIHRFFFNPSWRDLALYVGQTAARTNSATPTTEQRVDPRAPISVTAVVRCPSWDVVRQLYSVDLSEGGLSLLSPESAGSGTPVRVALTLPDGLRISLRGEVRHATPIFRTDGSVHWRLGIRLDRPNDRKRLVLRRLLRTSGQAGGLFRSASAG
jgi:CheY-like chemotaxis protein